MLTIELRINGELIREIKVVNYGQPEGHGDKSGDTRLYYIDENPFNTVQHRRAEGALKLACLALDKLIQHDRR